jgi:hypothetical protein
MWITVTEDMVKTRLAGAELTALRTAALSAGQADPLAEVIAEVVNEVRGYVAACKANRLESGTKIPEKLKTTALARIVFELASRLPVKGIVTAERKEANTAAKRLLEQVAACQFAVEEPVTPDAEKVSNPSPKITDRTLSFTREDQDGL